MAKRTNQKGRSKASKYTVKASGYSSDGEKVIWLFDMIDRSGVYAFDLNRDDFLHKEVMEKMIDYSNMTWAQVKQQTHDEGKSKHHLLSIDSISREALDRVKAKQLEDYSDAIFSFALQNKLRIIGIREREKFHVLWYDPEHKVCPSHKKHT
ncbi:MAG TPA: hypothetical protein IAA10_02535 [Candidatus Blautia intestinavium]|nr:hypothetical protein [Candidatus Blautia intestinavium]